MPRYRSNLVIALGLACGIQTTANAAIVVTVAQSGTNVVATLSGSLNLSGLTALPAPFGLTRAIAPSRGYIGLGTSPLTTGYEGLTGAGVFGPGNGFTFSNADVGDGFGLDTIFGSDVLFLPINYFSGALLSGNSTFNNVTIAGLGLTTGSYIFRSSSDTVTINIGAASGPVPEPATWAMMIGGFGAIGAAMRRRRRVSVTFA